MKLDPTDAPTPAHSLLIDRLVECVKIASLSGKPIESILRFGFQQELEIAQERADAAASRAPSQEIADKFNERIDAVDTWLREGDNSDVADLIQDLHRALRFALAAGARAVPSDEITRDQILDALGRPRTVPFEQEEMDRLRIEVETTKMLLAAWQKRAMEAERINPHGRMLTPEELEPFITEMRERTIPAIVKAIHQRQKDAAAMRHIPLSACAVPETQEAVVPMWFTECKQNDHTVVALGADPDLREYLCATCKRQEVMSPAVPVQDAPPRNE